MPHTIELPPSSLPKAWFSQLRKENARKSFRIAALVHIIVITFYIM